MTREHEQFIRDFLKELDSGDAAIFAGAGLSIGAGFVDWRGLLKEIADDLQLDIAQEYDLISVAQYHVNQSGGRGKLNRKIIEEFTAHAESSENHEILSRLPIPTFWTTNYDNLLEEALKSAGKKVDVKHSVKQLAHTLPKRDATVYKMHGDVSNPGDAILTKDDYESYHVTHQLFSNALSGDLITKTFLFIGFSFTDPNLDYVLSRVRIHLYKNSRPHYCFIKKVALGDKGCEEKALYEYQLRKQQLMIGDLNRFQIQPVLVDSYQEITEILKALEQQYKRKTVFVSGSAEIYDPLTRDQAQAFIHALSKELVKSKLRIVNGFGWGIGSAVINGALELIYSQPQKYSEDQLVLRPFPQFKTGTKGLRELWQEYRERMISFAGVAVFVFGNKKDPDSPEEIINAPGLESEFEIARTQGLFLIPVGATGFMSEELWRRVMAQFDEYYPTHSGLKERLESLGNKEVKLDTHIKTIVEIIKALNIE